MSGLYPYNSRFGQQLRTDGLKPADRAFAAHIHLSAEEAVAADADGVAVCTMAAETSAVTEGFANPAWPRALTVKANKSGITSNVTIKGLNAAGEAISEAFTLNGTTGVAGAKAFAQITKVELPAQANTPAKQVETATAAGTATATGNAMVTVTAAGMMGSPKAITVAIASGDDAAAIGGKIRAALAQDTAVAAVFDVSGTGTAIVLTRKVYAANDSTLNVAIATGTATGVTVAPSSADTTEGVAEDQALIGWNDIIGIPYKLALNTVLSAYHNGTKEANAPTVTVSATALESNTIDLHTALNGRAVDVFLLV